MKRVQEFLLHIDEPNRLGCFELLEVHQERIIKSPGSKKKHHAWAGGYLDHLADVMWFAQNLYPLIIEKPCSPAFSLGDAMLIIFIHDLEKPWKYVEPSKSFKDDQDKLQFILTMIEKFDIRLSENQKNGLQYIHGEGADYNPNTVIQKPIAAFCHICDTASARLWP